MRKTDTVAGLRRYEVEIGDLKFPVKQPTVMYVNAVDNREASKRIHEALRKDGWTRKDYRILSVRLACENHDGRELPCYPSNGAWRS